MRLMETNDKIYYIRIGNMIASFNNVYFFKDLETLFYYFENYKLKMKWEVQNIDDVSLGDFNKNDNLFSKFAEYLI